MLNRTEIDHFPIKWDKPPHGECHVFVGHDTATEFRKVWIDCSRSGGTFTSYISFHSDEIPRIIEALEKAQAELK